MNSEEQQYDVNANQRKQDHISLAFQSQVSSLSADNRFSYEPLLAAFPTNNAPHKINFLGKQVVTPIWVSSMTGGTEKAFTINTNLAKACAQFKMGMGLGSCRSLLESNDRIKDFDFRFIIGDELPFYANIGIAQLELLLLEKKLYLIDDLVSKLNADGIIIHVNPLQEWLQPEGNKLTVAPILTIERFLQQTQQKVIVKEVGQGMGKKSLSKLVQLPLEAIEFAAHGGTNFAKLELLRNNPTQQQTYMAVANIGHSAVQMCQYINELHQELGNTFLCQQFIISGGIKNFLDGHYLRSQLPQFTTVYGQAAALLQYAEQSYELLAEYLTYQIEGLKMANAYFEIR